MGIVEWSMFPIFSFIVEVFIGIGWLESVIVPSGAHRQREIELHIIPCIFGRMVMPVLDAFPSEVFHARQAQLGIEVLKEMSVEAG